MTPAELARFQSFVEPEPNTGCFLWSGAVAGRGYGVFSIGGKATYAHRLSYEHYVGSIPAGLQIDHLCRQTYCVNPLHLEPVSPLVNQLRGVGLIAQNAKKVRCLRGHGFTPRNTRINSDGSRTCRECRRLDARRNRRLGIDYEIQPLQPRCLACRCFVSYHGGECTACHNRRGK